VSPLPATPPDTHDYTTAVSEGFYGQRTDPLPDPLYTVSGGAAAATPPHLTACQPSSGGKAGGTTLNLGGSGLSAVLAVTVGQKACTAVTVVDDTKVTAVTPAGEGVGLTVTVANVAGRASLAGMFTYTEP
jgi:IPT/TIG domain